PDARPGGSRRAGDARRAAGSGGRAARARGARGAVGATRGASRPADGRATLAAAARRRRRAAHPLGDAGAGLRALGELEAVVAGRRAAVVVAEALVHAVAVDAAGAARLGERHAGTAQAARVAVAGSRGAGGPRPGGPFGRAIEQALAVRRAVEIGAADVAGVHAGTRARDRRLRGADVLGRVADDRPVGRPGAVELRGAGVGVGSGLSGTLEDVLAGEHRSRLPVRLPRSRKTYWQARSM